MNPEPIAKIYVKDKQGKEANFSIYCFFMVEIQSIIARVMADSFYIEWHENWLDVMIEEKRLT